MQCRYRDVKEKGVIKLTLTTSSEITPENWLESSVPPAPSMPRDSQFNHPRGLLDICSSSRGLTVLTMLLTLLEDEFNKISCRPSDNNYLYIFAYIREFLFNENEQYTKHEKKTVETHPQTKVHYL